MTFLLLALIVALIGVIPLLLGRQTKIAGVTFIIAMFVCWGLFYLGSPSHVWPYWGVFGFFVLLLWIISAIVHIMCTAEKYNSKFRPQWLFSILPPIILILLMFGRGCAGSNMLRAHDYADLIGKIENREWTRDVQPKDPKHVRLVPTELAIWAADKQLGEAPGAIGSQFEVSNDLMTLQMVQGELWYVAPIDFKGFAAWTATKETPGYVMVHAEDPRRPVIVKADEKFVYTPRAFFSKNLKRLLWNKGYRKYGLTDYSLEVDEDGKAWWVVTVFRPTIAWWGPKVIGVIIVDPTTGDDTLKKIGETPDWVDRVIPRKFTEKYIRFSGVLHKGWWNSVWAHKDITIPEEPNVVYGSDGLPYWVTGRTSFNLRDESLVGVYYTCTRTGKTTLYHAVGGTDTAVLDAVNNQVSYKKWHGASPSLYNIYGVMTSVVPLLGESHTFQGVALVRVDNLAVTYATDQSTAFRQYQNMLSQSGQQVTFETEHDFRTASGIVDRFAGDTRNGETTYFVHIKGIPCLFTGTSAEYSKLPLTKEGDQVDIRYIASLEDVIPISQFENTSLKLQKTPAQIELQGRVEQRKMEVSNHIDSRDVRGEINTMNDEEVKELLKLKKNQKK